MWIGTGTTFWGPVEPELLWDQIGPEPESMPWPLSYVRERSKLVRFRIWLGNRVERLGCWIAGEFE